MTERKPVLRCMHRVGVILTGDAEALTITVIDAVLNSHARLIVDLIPKKGARFSGWVGTAPNICEPL